MAKGLFKTLQTIAKWFGVCLVFPSRVVFRWPSKNATTFSDKLFAISVPPCEEVSVLQYKENKTNRLLIGGFVLDTSI